MNNLIRKGTLFTNRCLDILKQMFHLCLQPYRLKRFYHFLGTFNSMLASNQEEYPRLGSVKVKKLQQMASGLHRLLPASSLYTYSIIIPVYKPKASYFKIALESALNQTAPKMEVLVGFDGPQPADVYQVVEDLKKKYPEVLKSFQLDRATEGGSISASTNAIVKHATGNFILLMDHDDWIRPDLLYLYEKTLRMVPAPQNTVLYCNEYKIDEHDNPIPKTGIEKPLRPNFPYLTFNWICHCLLVPKNLWQKTGGLRIECNGAQDYDLALRLDIAGAEFYNVPFYLYAWRSHAESTAQNSQQKSYVFESGKRSLSDYCKMKKLDWKVEDGYLASTYRPLPAKADNPKIHIIMPYKDQKDLTLNTAKHALAQRGVSVQMTAVDNQSKDASIGDTLKEWGVEVIVSHDPFNYSKLNNDAVKTSRTGQSSDLLLFLHNDVILAPHALEEMCRWINQPSIGMVGCRLNYPTGLLQHGGIQIANNIGTSTEKGQPFEQLFLARTLRTVDAVTSACALIKRETFLKAGGFDEIWYPIIYSDVNLALRLKALGLSCLYTPYAVGTHHESTTHTHLEDYEHLHWVSNQSGKTFS